MALDNAQFISELSIIDPPGTDAVAEGDDHIRTVKRATQQSFPNVDAAVPQTAAQMGQMAIKNEVNTFTQVNHFTNRLDIDAANLRFELGGFDQGIQFRNTDVLQWQILGAAASANGDLEFLRYTGGIFQERTIVIERSTGTITFDSVDNLFKKTATFQFVAQFNGTSARCRSTNAGNDSGLLFIADDATQRWNLVRKSTNAGGALEIQRFTSAGVFIDSVMQIFPSGSVLFKTPFLVIQRPDAVSSSQLVFQNETTNRWFHRFNVADGRLQVVRLSGTGTEQDTPLQFRASDGVIIMATLPTVDPGVSGGLFLSSGFVAVSP